MKYSRCLEVIILLFSFLLSGCAKIFPQSQSTVYQERILFVAKTEPFGIYSMKPDGSDRQYITDGIIPTWSPDFTQVAFAGISIVDSDGNNIRFLTEGNHPDWSPSGESIAFARNYDIFTIKINGTNENRLTNNNYWDGSPDWSPDGTKIAYASDMNGIRSIFIMKSDGSDKKLFIEDAQGPSWSPDGKTILFSGNQIGIYTINIDGSDLTLLAEDGLGCAWSPDGSKIAYVKRYDNKLDEIIIMSRDGTNKIQITHNDFGEHSVEWYP
jgi:TolB protein